MKEHLEPRKPTIKQCIQRMQWIVRHWRKIEWPDRQFLLRKIRDEYPQDFWKVADEKLAKVVRP